MRVVSWTWSMPDVVVKCEDSWIMLHIPQLQHLAKYIQVHTLFSMSVSHCTPYFYSLLQNSIYQSSPSSSPPENTDAVRDSSSAQRATATADSRAEVKLNPCAQLSKAGS